MGALTAQCRGAGAASKHGRALLLGILPGTQWDAEKGTGSEAGVWQGWRMKLAALLLLPPAASSSPKLYLPLHLRPPNE